MSMLSPLRMPCCLRDCVPLQSEHFLIYYGYAEYALLPPMASYFVKYPLLVPTYLCEALFIGIEILLTNNVPCQ